MNSQVDWKTRLREIINEGGGEPFAVEPRHLNRIQPEHITDTFVEFTLERHRHIFGEQTLGEPSSGFVPTQQRFRLEFATDKLELISEDYQEPVIDWDLIMAGEGEILADAIFSDVKEDMERSSDPKNRTKWEASAKQRVSQLDFTGTIDILPAGCSPSVIAEYRERLLDHLLNQISFYFEEEAE